MKMEKTTATTTARNCAERLAKLTGGVAQVNPSAPLLRRR